MISQLRYIVIKSFSWVLSKIVPTSKKVIYFESFMGRQFSDNPRAIFDYINQEYPEYTCYWGVQKGSEANFNDTQLNLVPKLSLKWFYVLARSKYWVVNTAFHSWVVKSRKTVYLQTWHGTPLKKIGLDLMDDQIPDNWNKPFPYKEQLAKEGARWDYLVSPNPYSSLIFKRCFDFKGTMLETGYPRNDYLSTNQETQTLLNIKKRLELPLDKKIILYAPTWRDDNVFQLKLDMARLKAELGEEYFFVLRTHYSVTKVENYEDIPGFSKQLDQETDIRELYLVSDILITDYSSVFFDYAVLKRPIIFYCYDMDRYKEDLRGFYFDFEKEAPGPIVRTETDLLNAIDRTRFQGIQTDFVNDFLSYEDGHATNRVVDYLLDKSH